MIIVTIPRLITYGNDQEKTKKYVVSKVGFRQDIPYFKGLAFLLKTLNLGFPLNCVLMFGIEML
jgi:hypothetical protein